MIKLNNWLLLLLFAFAMTLSGCSGDEDPDPVSPSVEALDSYVLMRSSAGQGVKLAALKSASEEMEVIALQSDYARGSTRVGNLLYVYHHDDFGTGYLEVVDLAGMEQVAFQEHEIGQLGRLYRMVATQAHLVAAFENPFEDTITLVVIDINTLEISNTFSIEENKSSELYSIVGLGNKVYLNTLSGIKALDITASDAVFENVSDIVITSMRYAGMDDGSLRLFDSKDIYSLSSSGNVSKIGAIPNRYLFSLAFDPATSKVYYTSPLAQPTRFPYYLSVYDITLDAHIALANPDNTEELEVYGANWEFLHFDRQAGQVIAASKDHVQVFNTDGSLSHEIDLGGEVADIIALF